MSSTYRLMLYRAFVLLAVATPLGAQARPGEAAVILQAASHQETVVGNLDSAITLYRRVVDDRRADRRTVASALVSLGRAYEMRGQSDAVRTYQRVVNDFGDQSEQAATARQRLAALQGGVNAINRDRRDLVYSIAYDDLPRLRDHDAPHYDFSPDGERIAMRVPADLRGDSTAGASLVVVNTGGAVVRTLVPARREIGISFPRWSPDGKYIAYREGAWIGADTSYVSIKIIPAEGGTPRTVTTRYPGFAGARGGIFWTPDSKSLTTVSMSQVATFDLEGRFVREIPFKVEHLTQFLGYSPDGRWVAFHKVRHDSEEHEQMDIWIMPAQGGEPIQITQTEYWDAWAAWTPDSRGMYFVSNRGGSQNLWRVNLDPRSGAPQGDPVQVTSYTDVKLKHPRPLQNGKVAFALIRETSTIRVASTANPEVTRTIARGTGAQMSPDGRTVYYASQGVTPRGIFAVSTESAATPRRLTTAGPGNGAFGTFALSGDGRFIAYFAQAGTGSELRVVETSSGTSRQVVRLDTREFLSPAWSRDGSRLAYTHGDGLFVVPAQGGQPRKVAQLHKWEAWTLRWSPDDQHLAALAYATPTDSTNAAFVIPAAGGEARRITPKEETGYKEILEWHPDGRRLTYMYYGHDDRADETRFAYLDGRATTKLLDQPYPIWDYTGTWHPGGRDYYFIASTSGSWSLYAHDEQTGRARVVWHHAGVFPGASRPTFSRDGSMMAFETATTTRQLWMIDGVR